MASKYRELAKYLEEQIQFGFFAEGKFLPGERTLCEQFSMSRVTVRSALALLVEGNLVVPVPGHGHQVLGGRSRAIVNRRASHLIGGVFPATTMMQLNNVYISTPYMLMQGITRQLEGSGYSMTFANSGDDLLKERECIRNLIKCGMDGLLIQPAITHVASRPLSHDSGNYAFFKELYDSGVPIVLMDRELAGTGIPCVYNDDIAGGRMQAEHFIRRGFRRIIYFGFTDGNFGSDRFDGYCNAMETAGLPVRRIQPPEFVRDVPWDQADDRMEGAVRCLKGEIAEDTAVITDPQMICGLDRLFPGNRCGMHRVEWGCYDIPGRSPMPYPFMRRPLERIGELACRKLLRLIRQDKSAEGAEKLPPTVEMSR